MKQVKAIGIKELKNNLSAYLREVRLGVVVLVTDRDEVVAEFRKPVSFTNVDESPLALSWITEGMLRRPSKKKEKLKGSSVKVAEATAQKLLDEDRGQ